MTELLIAVLSLAGTFIGSYSGIRLMSYRIEQLEKKVEKHNNLIERTYRLEQHAELTDERLRTLSGRINGAVITEVKK